MIFFPNTKWKWLYWYPIYQCTWWLIITPTIKCFRKFDGRQRNYELCPEYSRTNSDKAEKEASRSEVDMPGLVSPLYTSAVGSCDRSVVRGHHRGRRGITSSKLAASKQLIMFQILWCWRCFLNSESVHNWTSYYKSNCSWLIFGENKL